MFSTLGCAIRVSRRGVPRGVGLYSRCPQGHSERHRYDQNDPTHQGPVAPSHSHPEE